MSVQVAAPTGAATPAAPWSYAEYMARWERRQHFLRSYHFSRDADADAPVPVPPRSSSSYSPRARARARRVVWAGLRRLRRAAATGLRRLRARLRLCFGWATLRARRTHRGSRAGFRYGRLSSGGSSAAGTKAARTRTTTAASVFFW